MRSSFRPLIFIFAAVVIIVVISMLNRPEEGHDPTPWRTDLAAARAESAKTGKPLIAWFTATWCPPCQKMAGTTFPNAAVQLVLKDYVPVKIDIDEHQDLAAAYHADQIPHFVLMDPSGQTTAIATGYMPPADFVSLLTRPVVVIQTRPATQPATRP